MQMTTRKIVPLLTIATGAWAQSSLDVPAQPASMEGSSVSLLAPAVYRGRQEYLIAGAHLVAAKGKAITEIWFRRDGLQSQPLPAVLADVELILSSTPTAPEAASPLFSSNHAENRTTCFSGQIQFPQSPGVSMDRWAPDQTVRIRLTTAFFYAGNTLCIEVRGAPSPTSPAGYWPIDAVDVGHDGKTAIYGSSCAGFAANNTQPTLTAAGDRTMVGGSLSLTAYGRQNTPGALILGQPLAGGADLTGIGMTGCTLYVAPAVTMLVSFTKALPGNTPGRPAVALVDIHVPFHAAFLGGKIDAQAANVENGSEQSNPLGVTLSQAVSMTLASSLSSLGMVTVETRGVDASAPYPEEGRVIANQGPVLRLLYQ